MKTEDQQRLSLQELLGVVLADVRACERRRKRSDSQINRRQYVRTIFFMVEAVCCMMRHQAKQFVESSRNCKIRNMMECEDNTEFHRKKYEDIRDSHHHLSLLSECAYVPGPTGKLKRQDNKIPFGNLVAFSIRSWAEHARWFDCGDFFFDNGWAQFRKAIKIRNGITHPKHPGDVDLSDEDMTVVEEGGEWFQLAVHEIVHSFRTREAGQSPSIARARKELAEQTDAQRRGKASRRRPSPRA